MSIRISNPETAAALRHVLEKFSGHVSGTLALARDTLAWHEYDTLEIHLVAAENAVHQIIAEMLKKE